MCVQHIAVVYRCVSGRRCLTSCTTSSTMKSVCVCVQFSDEAWLFPGVCQAKGV